MMNTIYNAIASILPKQQYGLFIFVFVLLGACQSHNPSTQPPNVLLVVVDDQGYADMGCADLADDVLTPNIDQLAQAGIRFTQAYATSPICSPSRAGLISGCYQQRWGTYWYGGKGLHLESYVTIAELLKEAGYQTAYIGKVHYGSHDADTNHRSFPLNHGFDYYFGHTSARKHYLNHEQLLEDDFQEVKKSHQRKGQSLRQQSLWENTGYVDTIAFSTTLFANKACEFIQKHGDEQFFLQLSFNAVHNFTHQLPEDYLRDNNLEGYHDWNPATEDYYEWYQRGRKPNNPEGRALYLGQLHHLDLEIGKVLNCLKQLGLFENTIIIYISDNGGSTPIYANNYPLRGSKYLLYEGGIRVPMILSYPKFGRKGQLIDNMISAMDILPTICNLTHIQTPPHIDGMDISPLLSGSNPHLQHDTLYWDSGHEYAVRAGEWKYFHSMDDANANYEMVEVELGEFLYNLNDDPSESINLATQFPDILESLREAHLKWKSKLEIR